MKKIKLLALDIDGVLTDGRTTLGVPGPERKRLAFQDLDAINAAKREGLIVALVTGESDASVDLVATRTGVTLVRRGAKDKLAALQNLSRSRRLSLEEICYVGDGNRDAPALARVGLAFAPNNATFAAKRAAHHVVDKTGGHGVVAEVVRLLLLKNEKSARGRFFEEELRHQLLRARVKRKLTHQFLGKTLVPLTLEMAKTIELGGKIMLFGDQAALVLASLFSGRSNWPVVELSAVPRVMTRQFRALGRPGDLLVGFCIKKHLAGVVQELVRGNKQGVAVYAFYKANGLDPAAWRAIAETVRVWRAVR